jgi:hypothetical protein
MNILNISALFLLTTLPFINTPAFSETKITAVEGISYDIEKPLADNLQSLIGKKITVTLRTGASMTGMVKDANNILLHLEKLEGKEYFDALIVVDDISAIETRYRMPAR